MVSTLFVLTAVAVAISTFLAGVRIGALRRSVRSQELHDRDLVTPAGNASSLMGETGGQPSALTSMPGPPSSFGNEIAAATQPSDFKVLIVDDEPINVLVTQEYLRLAGYQNTSGEMDATKALERIAQEQPDIVLIDIMMPEVNGLEILEKLRADPQWTFLPVIVVTAADDDQTRLRALELGATDFLSKPVNGTELVPRVRNALLIKSHRDYLRHYARALERQTRHLEAQIAQARTDSLTGLANRRALDEELQRRYSESQRTGSPLSIMLIDVDHFKGFNDRHGHRAGDEALRVIAATLRDAMRQMDLVARYGGEEFVVLLPGTAIEGAILVAERTRQDLADSRFRYDGKEFSLTVSIGVAQLATNEHVSRMLQRVDQALYAAKGAGRNRSFWNDGRSSRSVSDTSNREVSEPPISSDIRLSAVESGNRSGDPDTSSTTTWTDESDASSAFAEQCDRVSFHRFVQQRIAEWNRGGRPFCVLMVRMPCPSTGEDLKASERHSDTLRRMGRLLPLLTRQMDVTAPYDHETFSILLPGTSVEKAQSTATRLREYLESTCPPQDQQRFRTELRIGIAEVGEGDDLVRLLQRAWNASFAPSGGESSGVPRVTRSVSSSVPLMPNLPTASGLDSPLSSF
jgi:diguanylate cyclase (GGDEF)-like protein